jgi:prepilin-type N-terminal cleavage/methylation domain-containing protein
MKKNQKGFTVIELIVVIVIIAILSTLVFVRINDYRNKAKLARVNVEVNNIEKALIAFKTKYGNYPCDHINSCDYGFTWFFPSNLPGGTGDPYLIVNEQRKYLSSEYKMDWTDYNAKYFTTNGYYKVSLCGDSNSIECGVVELFGITNGYRYYGFKNILSNHCNCLNDFANIGPFQINPYF